MYYENIILSPSQVLHMSVQVVSIASDKNTTESSAGEIQQGKKFMIIQTL